MQSLLFFNKEGDNLNLNWNNEKWTGDLLFHENSNDTFKTIGLYVFEKIPSFEFENPGNLKLDKFQLFNEKRFNFSGSSYSNQQVTSIEVVNQDSTFYSKWINGEDFEQKFPVGTEIKFDQSIFEFVDSNRTYTVTETRKNGILILSSIDNKSFYSQYANQLSLTASYVDKKISGVNIVGVWGYLNPDYSDALSNWSEPTFYTKIYNDKKLTILNTQNNNGVFTINNESVYDKSYFRFNLPSSTWTQSDDLFVKLETKTNLPLIYQGQINLTDQKIIFDTGVPSILKPGSEFVISSSFITTNPIAVTGIETFIGKNATTFYPQGSQVLWNNKIYQCIQSYTWSATSSVTPDDTLYWTKDITYLPIDATNGAYFDFANVYLTTNKLLFTQSFTSSADITLASFVDKYKDQFSLFGVDLIWDKTTKTIISELRYPQEYANVEYYKNSFTSNNIGVKEEIKQRCLSVDERIYLENNKNTNENFSYDIVFADLDEYGIKLIINGREYTQEYIASTNEDGIDVERSIYRTILGWLDKWKVELFKIGIITSSKSRGETDLPNTINLSTEYPNVPLTFNVEVGSTADYYIPHSKVVFNDMSNYLMIVINGRSYGTPVDISSGTPKITEALIDWVNSYFVELEDFGIYVESSLDILYFKTKKQSQRLEYTINVGKGETPGVDLFTISDLKSGMFGALIASNELRMSSDGTYSFEANPFATGQVVAINNSVKPYNNQEYNILYLNPYNIVLSYQGPFWGTWQDPCLESPYLTLAFSNGFGATGCPPKPTLIGDGGVFNNDFNQDFVLEFTSNNRYIVGEVTTTTTNAVDIIHLQKFNKILVYGDNISVFDSTNMNFMKSISLNGNVSPKEMKYNPQNDLVYCLSKDNLYVINPSNDSLSYTIGLSFSSNSLSINTSKESTSGDVLVTYGASASKVDIWSKTDFDSIPTKTINLTGGGYSVTFDTSVENDFYVIQDDNILSRINGINRTIISTFSISNLNTDFIGYESLNSSVLAFGNDLNAINSNQVIQFGIGTFSESYFRYDRINTQSILSVPNYIYKLDTNDGTYDRFNFPFRGNLSESPKDGDLYMSTIDSKVVIMDLNSLKIKSIQNVSSSLKGLIYNSDRESMIGIRTGTNKLVEISSFIYEDSATQSFPYDSTSYSYYGTLAEDYVPRPDVWLKTREYIRSPRENFEGETQVSYIWKWETDEYPQMFLYDFSGDQLPITGSYAYVGEKPLPVVALNKTPNKNIDFVSSPQHQQTIFDQIIKPLDYIDSSENYSIVPEPMQIFLGFRSDDEGPIKTTLKLYKREVVDFTINTTLTNNNILSFGSSGFIQFDPNSEETFNDKGLKEGQIIKIYVTDTKTRDKKISMNNGLTFKIKKVYIRKIEVDFLERQLIDETTVNGDSYFNTRFVIQDKEIGSFDVYGQTEIEDIRYKIELSNVGQNVLPEDVFIFKEYDINEQGMDWTFLNKKRKEMMYVRHDIFPYVGSYKAIINAINFFGYNDLELYEYYRNINVNSPDFFKLFKVEIPDIFDNTVEGWKESDFVNISEPDPNFEDTNLFNLTYKITDKQGNNVLTYSLQEVILKLQGLKYWLMKNVIPVTHRILDITGRADFVGDTNIVHRNYDCKILNVKENMTPVNFTLNEAYLMPVNSGSTVYVCHIDFTTEDGTIPDFFDMKIRTYKTYKEWSPFFTYQIGDEVTYYGKVYESVLENNKLKNPRKYETITTWSANHDYVLGDFTNYNRGIYQYVGTQSSFDHFGTQSSYTPLSDLLENQSFSVWRDNTEWLLKDFEPVQTLNEYRTGLHSYNFTVDSNLDPFITIEVTTDNGYGQVYSVRKNYEIRGLKDLQEPVRYLDPVGPFVPISYL